nr:reverse transcriptase domain-containing protein [Tanacetum cinerariifolium]
MRTRRSYFSTNVTIPRRRQRKQTSNIVEPEFRTIVEMADNRTMAQMLQAPIEGYEDAIVVPPINANNFELKQTLINLVQSNQFTGRQDPHNHLRFFNKVTSTFRHPEVPNTTIKLLLFPFSLEGEARTWLDKEPPHSILTREDLVSKFINQFFPPSKTTYLRNEIINFLQKPNETFNEAWERFKDLLRQCPHHGFSELHQLDTFYNALNPNDQDALDFAAGGNFLDKIPRESSLEDKLDIRMSRFEKSLNDMKASFVTPTAPIKAVKKTAAIDNFIQGNRHQNVSNQMQPPGFNQPNQQNNQNHFIVLDFIADPRVPLILGRPFLSTAHAIINVHEREIILRQDKQSLTLQCGATPSIKKFKQINKIDFIDAGESDSEEIENFLNDDSIPIGVENFEFNMEEYILFLERLLSEDPSPPPLMNPNQTKPSIEEPEHSFSMGYEHFSTTLVTNEVTESSTKNLIPIPLFTTFSNPLFNNDEIDSDELESLVESDSVESTSNHDTVKIENLDEFFGPLIPIHITEEERIRREHADYINRMEMLFTINPHPLVNANTNVESLPSLPIPVQDNDSQREEIDIIISTDDVLPLGVENDDLDGEVDVVDALRVDNSILNSEHEFSESEESDFDNPLVPLPPPKPPDEEFDCEIDFGDEILVVRNTIVKFECIDARVKFDDKNDDYSYFMFDKVFSFLSVESADTIFDPSIFA